MQALSFIVETRQDASGHTVYGIRLGCCGDTKDVGEQSPVSTFLPDSVLRALGISVNMLIDRDIKSEEDA